MSGSGTKTILFGVCGTFAVVLIGVVIACIADSVHVIDEGTVGVYYLHGALQEKTSPPGVAWKSPFFSTVEEITIRDHSHMMSAIFLILGPPPHLSVLSLSHSRN